MRKGKLKTHWWRSGGEFKKSHNWGEPSWNKGSSYSKEIREKMSISHIGKKLLEETKRKISIANKGQIRTKKIERLCKQCKKIFYVTPSRAKLSYVYFCSKQCKIESRKEIICKGCGKTFRPYNAEIKKGGGKFCSKKCYHKWHSGENNSSWRGGITPLRKKIYRSPEYQQWRRTIFIRDEFTCQNCGVKSINIQAHHIKPWKLYPKLIFEIENGITYCKSCHCLIEPRNELVEYYKNMEV